MAKPQERRGAARVAIPEPLGKPADTTVAMRLLDLSTTGARFAHLDPLRPGVTYALHLPPALGALALAMLIIHSRVVGTESSPTGERLLRYESGGVFLDLTEEQRATLEGLITQLVPKRRGPDESPPGWSETSGEFTS